MLFTFTPGCVGALLCLLSTIVGFIRFCYLPLALSVRFPVHGMRPEEWLISLDVHRALHDFVARADEAAESGKASEPNQAHIHIFYQMRGIVLVRMLSFKAACSLAFLALTPSSSR